MQTINFKVQAKFVLGYMFINYTLIFLWEVVDEGDCESSDTEVIFKEMCRSTRKSSTIYIYSLLIIILIIDIIIFFIKI